MPLLNGRMSLYIYVDVETTGVKANDEIVSIGLIYEDKSSYDLVLPSKKIKPKAMAVHHITNEMVKTAPPIKECDTFKLLESLNDVNNILIIHNAQLIYTMLEKTGFSFKGEIIDTQKSTKHLIPECEYFELQYLRYELKLYKEEKDLAQDYSINLFAHNALSDAIHIKLLHNYLLCEFDEKRLIESKEEQTLLFRLPFGKYRNRHIEDIARKDPKYLQWILNDMIDIDEDLRYSIEYFLNEVNL